LKKAGGGAARFKRENVQGMEFGKTIVQKGNDQIKDSERLGEGQRSRGK